jgi:integrase
MGDERKRTTVPKNGVKIASASSIQIAFTYKTRNFRERLKLKPTTANLKRAAQHRAAILDAIERGTFDYAATFPESPNRFLFAEYKGEGYKLEDWLEQWLERQKKHLKSSTHDGYRKIVFNVLIPEFGQKTLSEFRRSDVRDWCNKQKASNKRLSNVQSVLRAALQAALDDDLIESNPLHGWCYSRKEAPSPVDEIDPFTTDEQSALLAACRDPQHRNLFQFAFWTGLRTSELVALKWGDIDWRRNIVRISRAKTQASDEHETTKTRRGTRDVKLLDPAVDALVAQKSHSYLAGLEVFLNPLYGEPWVGDQAIRSSAWIPALKRAGIRYRNPYQTRHTYASMMLSASENPVWIAGQMGHADTAMIFRNYGRWIEDTSSNAGSKAVAMFSISKKDAKPKSKS